MITAPAPSTGRSGITHPGLRVRGVPAKSRLLRISQEALRHATIHSKTRGAGDQWAVEPGGAQQPVPVVERRGDQQRVDPAAAADEFQQRHHETDDHRSEHTHDATTGSHREQQRQAHKSQHRGNVEKPTHEHQPQAFAG